MRFYDRMERVREGQWFTYWDIEPYARLSTFLNFKTFLSPPSRILLNGKPVDRIGYESVDEIPFGKIHGIEHMRCAELPERLMRWIPIMERGRECWAVLLWRGSRRIRQIQEPREASEGVSRLWAKDPGDSG